MTETGIIKRFFLGLNYILTGHYTFTQAQREEALQVKALKKQVEVQDDVINSLQNQLKSAIEIKNANSIWDVVNQNLPSVINALIGTPDKKQLSNTEAVRVIEAKLNSAPLDELKTAMVNKEKLIEKIKGFCPTIENKDIKYLENIIVKRLENGD